MEEEINALKLEIIDLKSKLYENEGALKRKKVTASGIANPGNCCFMICVLQVLFHLNEFSIAIAEKPKGNSISNQLHKVFSFFFS